jgi:membrane-associated phospholipid phosphatase
MIARPNSSTLQAVSTHRRAITTAVLGILAPLIAFVVIAEDVLRHEAFSWDLRTLETLHAKATPTLDAIMLTITHAGDVNVLGGFLIIALLGMWFGDLPRNATFLALSSGGAAVINIAHKSWFQRPRPELWVRLIPEHDFGFPSGHAMGSVAVVTALMVLAWPSRWRWAVIVLGMGFALAVCVSRLYLGVHYPSDVIAGSVLTKPMSLMRLSFSSPKTALYLNLKLAACAVPSFKVNVI